MKMDIKSLLLEVGIVDSVQQQLRQGLKTQSIRGKEIDKITAGQIKNIRVKADQKVQMAPKKKEIAPDAEKKVINESIIITRRKYFTGGIPPTKVKGNDANGLKGIINAEQGAKEVQSHDAKAAQGLKPGNRSIQESSMGYVKPLPRKTPGAVIEARNEKNAVLKPHKEIPSAFETLKNNPTRVAKIGHKVNRDLMNQTNMNGEGVR